MRISADFEDLPAYRRFVDEIVSRRNARHRPRIEVERAQLKKPARAAHQRLRGSRRKRHILWRLHLAQGVLHGPFAPDRPSAASAAL